MKKISVAVIAALFAILSVTAVFAQDTAAFSDVTKGKWYYDSVMYVAGKGIMEGTGGKLFRPDGSVSRAQLITTLYRLEGEPEAEGEAEFSDVKASSWYYPAVVWANENGIVQGYSDGKFKPDQPVIREQIAAVFYRYMKYAGASFTGDFNFKMSIKDTAQASDYAMDAIYWMLFKGIMQGDNEQFFKPDGVASRAQLAAMLTKYIKQKESTAVDENKERAEEIVAAMSLKEKIGQMLMVEMRTYGNGSTKKNVTALNSALKKAIKKYDFGGVILFAQNISSAEQTTRLVADMQNASDTPLLIGVDQEGGRVVRSTETTGFGGNMALAATRDTTLTYNVASVIGREMSSMGINVDFAPCMDINTNPDNPVIGTRSFSDDPEIASEFGAAFISGLHNGGIATAIKHFPGHGDTATDSHTGLPLVDKYFAEIAEKELIPFYSGIKAGTDIVMTAHIQFPKIEKDTYVSELDGTEVGIPATLSDEVITGILRNKMGYDGVVITDAMNMDAIARHFDSRDAAKLAINAGVDMLLMPVDMSTAAGIEEMGRYIDDIAEMVENGEISMEEIDDSAVRVVKLKIDRGIWDAEKESTREKVKAAKAIVGCEAHRSLEWEAALKAVTLVKNNGILPLRADETDNLGVFFPYEGESVMTDSALNRLKSEGITGDAFNINNYVYGEISDEALEAAIAENDALVVVSEMSSPAYLDPSTAKGKYAAAVMKIISAAHQAGKKAVIISANLPYDAAYFTSADAILCTYCCKTSTCSVGAGLYSLFINTEKITGKLPVKL